MKCMYNNGFAFLIFQAWICGSGLNGNLASNIVNAKSAGIPYVDVYVFADTNCGANPGDIMSEIKSHLPSVFNGMVWLDVEPCAGCWSDGATNLAFVNSMAVASQGAGFHTGVYANYNGWTAVMGSAGASTPTLKALPIWYPNYDGQQNYNDWQAFGGWNSPAMKQYDDGGSVCGFDFDYDWYP